MSEIELHDRSDGTAVTFLPGEATSARVWKLANAIARTEFVPGSLRGKPEAIMAAMLTGREVGIGAMHALRAIDVIDGRPSLSPELLHAMALKAGHDVDVEESTRSGCTVAIRRRDWPEDRVRRVTFDEVDARLAGLVGPDCAPADGKHVNDRETRSGNPTCACKQGYRTYPRAMYRARAVAEGARSHLPDVVERIGYTAEEMGGTMARHEDAMDTVDAVAPDQAPATEAAWDVGAEADTDPDDDGGDVVDAEIVPDGDDDGGDTAADDDPGTDTPDEGPVDDAATSDAPQEQAPADPEPDTAPEERAEAAPARTDEAGSASVPLGDVYDSLNVADVGALIRSGTTTVTVDGREVTVTGTPHEVWTYEQAKPGPFRKTVKGALDAVGYSNAATKDTADDDTTAAPGPATTPANDVSREDALRTYKRLYREVYADEDKSYASRMHKARIDTLGSADDEAFQTAPAGAIVTLLDEASAIHTEATDVPF